MLKIFAALSCIMILLVCNQSYAENVEYSLRYSQKNKVSGPTLSSATLMIQLHANGNSVGKLITHTDQYGKFILNNRYGSKLIVHIISIKETQKNIRCRGANFPGGTIIIISCHRISDRPYF